MKANLAAHGVTAAVGLALSRWRVMRNKPKAYGKAGLTLALRPLETPVIVGASALLWVGCVTLNNHLAFEWTGLTDFRHLIFVPAGLKLALLMALGVRAAFGIALGTLTFLPSDLPTLSPVQVVALVTAYVTAPLIVIAVFSRVTGLVKPWFGLRLGHLALLTVVAAVATSVTFNGLLAAWGVVAGSDVLHATVAMAGGDVVGGSLLLASVLSARTVLRILRR